MHTEPITTAVVEYYELEELSEDEQDLVLSARHATERSYAPYSKYNVGSALRLRCSSVIIGANQENAAFGLCCCAERAAIFAAGNEGRQRDIRFIAVTARPANAPADYVGTEPVAPCGACRQVINEAEDLAHGPIVILMDCFDDKRIARVVSIKNLLPFPFGPANLGINV